MAVSESKVDIENLKGAIALGQQTLRSLQLVNGGAVVAILTFYGNVVRDESDIDLVWLTGSMGVFAAGLFLAVVATICAYLGQLAVATSEPDKPMSVEARRIHVERRVRQSVCLIYGAIGVGGLSTLAFAGGTGLAIRAFSSLSAG